jgi:hypothetical protein
MLSTRRGLGVLPVALVAEKGDVRGLVDVLGRDVLGISEVGRPTGDDVRLVGLRPRVLLALCGRAAWAIGVIVCEHAGPALAVQMPNQVRR